MDFRELLVPISLSLLTVWGIQYYASRNSVSDIEIKPGQEFIVSPIKEVQKPLNRDVSYQCSSNEIENFKPETVNLVLEREKISFSNKYAVMNDLSFKHFLKDNLSWIRTIHENYENYENTGSAELRSFLVAFQDKTPVIYTLTENIKDQNRNIVTYQAESDLGKITKQFIIYNNSFKLDLNISIEPKAGQSIQPRVFIVEPFVKDMGDNNLVMALFNTQNRAIEKRKPAAVLESSWFRPVLFGIENRYFIHALVTDSNKFSQRGYFAMESDGKLMAILEGPSITEKTSWLLSFYMGPKIAADMSAVDKRLENTLDYGWLSYLAKIFVKLLNFIYSYVPNYGLAIVVLTIIVNLIMLPFAWKGQKSANKMGELQRKVQYLEQRYKNDPETLAREKTEAMKKLGLSGIFLGYLPIFAQIPIFIGLNRALSTSIELYQAPFFGWITDLSAKDPYYILPLLFFIGLLTRSANIESPGSGSSKVNIRQRLVSVLMSLIVSAVFTGVSAGLCLFVCVSTWFSVLQMQLQKVVKI